MTVRIGKSSTAKNFRDAKRRLKSKKSKVTGLAKYFGALKRGIDGLKYQKNIRNEWSQLV